MVQISVLTLVSSRVSSFGFWKYKLTPLQSWLARLSAGWRQGSRCWRSQRSTLEVTPTGKIGCQFFIKESLSHYQFPGYQVLPEAVQPRILDFPSLLDDHEGEDTEKSCNLKHRACEERIKRWRIFTSKQYLIASESPRGFPFSPFMRRSSKGGLRQNNIFPLISFKHLE